VNLFEIIESASTDRELATPEGVANVIRSQCQPWFAEGGGIHPGKIIYRGQSTSPKAAFVKTIRTDRVPMNMSSEHTELLNDVIDEAGLRANRTNSMFVSGDEITALEYGIVHVAFPIGNFNYTWSTLLSDWYVNFNSVFRHAGYEVMNVLIYKDPTDEAALEKFHEAFIPTLKGDDRSLLWAIRSGKEIMVHASHSLLIDQDFYLQEVLPLLDKSIQK